MNRYEYNGPVTEFGKCICNNWYGVTYAVSERKARNNLTFKFKQEYDKTPNSKITLPGKLVLVERS